MWHAFGRTTPHPSTPPSSVQAPGAPPPASEHAALNNLAAHFAACCSTFPPTDESRVRKEVVDEFITQVDPAEDGGVSDRPFTLAQVEAVCKRAKVNSAMGPDSFSPHFLVHGGPSLYACLGVLINFSWKHAVLPLEWRSANIFALFKGKGAAPSLPDSYRPISLTSVVVKVVERLVLTRIDSVFTPSPFQAGFRARHSCNDQQLRLQSLLHSTGRGGRAENKYRSVVFIDFSKAFDKVWHEVLLWKLWRAGVRGRTWRWVRAFLTGRRIRIAHRSAFSDWHDISAGAPQGAILSPKLFLIFIDDLPSSIPLTPSRVPNCHMFLFADDVALSGLLGGPRGDEQLNKALRAVARWMLANLMRASASKTQAVCFNRQRTTDPVLPRIPLLLAPLGVLAVVGSYPYLGLLYQSKIGTFPLHAAAVLNKVRRAASFALRIVGRSPTSECAVRVVRTIVAMAVAPIFTYALPFWIPLPRILARVDSIMAAPLRRALRLPASTSVASVLAECGVLSSTCLLHRSAITFGRRALHLPPAHLTPAILLNPAPDLPFVRRRIEAELALGISHRLASRADIRRAVLAYSMASWRARGHCRDLMLLRPALPAAAHDSAAFSIRHDPRAHLRARLRLNRSSLNDSQHRRGMLADPACRCGVARETPTHLLACPFYAAAAAAFLNHALVNGDASRLLGDLLLVRKADRAAVLALGSIFLAHVDRVRPGGI